MNPNRFMNKKDYRKPTMKVVKLQHKCHILTTSGQSQATMNVKYTEETWNEE